MKRFFSFLLVSISVLHLFAQSPYTDTKTMATRFAKLWHFDPQEKIYIHTDKPYYNAGETLWFRAFLVNAATHRPDTKSRFVYVELIDRTDSVVSRLKIRKDSLGFAGNFNLSPEINAGRYTLRAYTYWMQNTPDFLFTKSIQIENSIDNSVHCKQDFVPLDNGNLQLRMQFSDAYGKALAGKSFSMSQSWISGKNSRLTATSQADGKVVLNLVFDSTLKEKKYLEIRLKEPGLNYKNTIVIPEVKKDIDVQFFPESGTFLDNESQNVAFKVLGSDGYSVEAEGQLFNQHDEELLEFKTAHKGMGKFFLKTNPKENYYALIKTSNGISKKIVLPATKSDGVSLKLAYNRNHIHYQLINKSPLPTDSLSLMVHLRGVLYLLLPLTNLEGLIPEQLFPAGVAVFSIIDRQGNTWAERLYFNRNFQPVNLTVLADKTSYNKREAMYLEFKLLDSAKQAFKGELSLSVTDSKVVLHDSLGLNIQNDLLLSSDLKGNIENPGEYFIDNSAVTREKTDMLMMTQGWRRFNTAELIKQKYPPLDFYMEVGQTLSGKVQNVLNKPVKDREVIMFSAYKNSVTTALTDSAGMFVIDGIEFPDSTGIVLKAKSKSKLVDVILTPDKDVFPLVKLDLPNENLKIDLPPDYFELSKQKYYTDGGMMVVNLDDFTVNATAKPTNPTDALYASLADNKMDAAKIEEWASLPILDIFAMLPGVQVNGQDISVRGASGNPLFVIDGIETDRVDDVMYLNTSDVEAIYLFKGVSTTMFGSKGGNGVIAVSLKKGAKFETLPPSSLARISPLGFQKPDAFYMPQYAIDSVRTDKKPDMRTTVYWNPQLIPDSNGVVQVGFYTADRKVSYNAELEGIGENGEIVRFIGIVRKED